MPRLRSVSWWTTRMSRRGTSAIIPNRSKCGWAAMSSLMNLVAWASSTLAGSDEDRSSRPRSVSRTESQISIWNRESDRYPEQCVTNRPLEHIFWEFVSWLSTSIEVLVSTYVSPFKDLYKSAHLAHCMYIECYYFELSLCFLLSLSLLCILYS